MSDKSRVLSLPLPVSVRLADVIGQWLGRPRLSAKIAPAERPGQWTKDLFGEPLFVNYWQADLFSGSDHIETRVVSARNRSEALRALASFAKRRYRRTLEIQDDSTNGRIGSSHSPVE